MTPHPILRRVAFVVMYALIGMAAWNILGIVTDIASSSVRTAGVVLQPSSPVPYPAVSFRIEAVHGVSPDEAERLIVALAKELEARGRYHPDAERVVRIEVTVSIGEPVPPQPEDARWYVERDKPVAATGRRVVIDWLVVESGTGQRLGTLRQRNWVPAEYDPWDAFVDHGGVPAAVVGLLKLTEER